MTIAVMITHDHLPHLQAIVSYINNNQKPQENDEAILWLNDSIEILKGKYNFSEEQSI